MPDGEALSGWLIARLVGQPLDIRRRRPAPQSLDHRRDRRFLSRDQRLDATVLPVAYPTADAQRVGLLLGPSAEEDALDTSGNRHTPGSRHH